MSLVRKSIFNSLLHLVPHKAVSSSSQACTTGQRHGISLMLTLLTCRDGDWQPKRTKLRPSNNHAAPRVTELMQWAPGPYSLRDITNPAGIAAPCFANNFFTLSSQPRFLL